MHELGVDVEFIGRNATCLRNDLISDYVGKASFFELRMRNEPNAGLQRGARSASELKGSLLEKHTIASSADKALLCAPEEMTRHLILFAEIIRPS
jgi:hypothetical protein